jgi:EsV-1-7 cysteine-rich motif
MLALAAGCSDTAATAHTTTASALSCTLNNQVDIKNRRCETDGCGTHPTYGFPGQKRTMCGAHKQPGMVDFKSRYLSVTATIGSVK